MSSFWEDTQYLLSVDFVQSSLIASALLGILSGVMTSLIVLRQMSFSVHATSELALMGASAALLFGLNLGFGAVAGAIVAAIILAMLGFKGQQDSAIGVVMSFGLGLSVLFLHLYPGNSNTAMTLLTGQIVGVSSASVWLLAATTVIIVAAVGFLWRPMLFASADPDMARAAGVPTRAISVAFAVLVGLAAAQSVQIVGSLLVMALLITPRRGGGTDHLLAPARGAVVHHLRRGLRRGRFHPLPRPRPAGFRLRDHHFLCDLPGVPVHRLAARQARHPR